MWGVWFGALLWGGSVAALDFQGISQHLAKRDDKVYAKCATHLPPPHAALLAARPRAPARPVAEQGPPAGSFSHAFRSPAGRLLLLQGRGRTVHARESQLFAAPPIAP